VVAQPLATVVIMNSKPNVVAQPIVVIYCVGVWGYVVGGMHNKYKNRAIGNSENGNRKQKMENGNSKILMYMYIMVKPLINDRPPKPPLYKDQIIIRFQR